MVVLTVIAGPGCRQLYAIDSRDLPDDNYCRRVGVTLSESVSFAVGSLFFEVPDAKVPSLGETSRDYLTPKEYVEKVRGALETISAIDNLVVETPQSYSGRLDSPWEIPHIFGPHKSGPHPGGAIVPHFSTGYIGFTLHVPNRMQSDLLFRSKLPAEVENFRVDIHYGGRFPVAFVSPTDPVRLDRPSTALILVREFLEREFQHRLPNSDVTFCFLGPSPLWANCVVEPGPDGISSRVEYAVEQVRRGYNRLRFSYSRQVFSNGTDAFEAIQGYTVDDLGVYYFVENEMRSLQAKWRLIDLGLADLIRLHQSPGLYAAFRRIMNSGRQSRELTLRILDAEAATAATRTYATSAIDEIRRQSELPSFLEWHEIQMGELESVGPPQVSEIASFLDAVHARTIQTLVVLVASALGGVAGAALTLLLAAG